MIAVITPVYNGALSIERAIESLCKQTFTQWIHIIINDGSVDNTKNLLAKYEDDPRWVIIHLDSNKGRGYARNLGLSKAKELNADYMCMLDADDIYAPEKLESQYNFMQSHKHIALRSDAIGVVNHTGLYRVYEVSRRYWVYRFLSYEKYATVPHASSIIRLSEVAVEFDPNLKYAEDQDFMRRFLINKKYAFYPEISYYYFRDNSFSIKKYKESLQANYQSFAKLKMNAGFLLKMKIVNFMKWILFIFCTLLNLKSLYFNKIGREPLFIEKNKFNDLQNQ